MKRLLLICALATAALALWPIESHARCDRIGQRVGAVLRAPFKLGKLVRARRCDCATSCECPSACVNCSR